jgi:sulfoxide reductase catalytic subunit YedY
MLIKKQNFESDIHWYDITDKDLYINRRKFIKGLGKTTVVAALALLAPPFGTIAWARDKSIKLRDIEKSTYSTDESPNKYNDVTSYNNFYEFGLNKTDPARNAKNFKPRPWVVSVDGHVRNPGEYDVDKLIKRHKLEERIYRLRCVEAWSMIIPWVGIPLADVIGELEPTSKAKYVQFTTLYDPEQMPGQKSPTLDWPYVEGLRMDEAMHPLTILAIGLYGEVLPNQNGAPIRLIVPWKYGFKSLKSIVRISFVEEQPKTTWSHAAPNEYGFYANVNPEVDHPRWSQKTEQAVGKYGRKSTVLFNGYGEYVTDMYSDLDLGRYY